MAEVTGPISSLPGRGHDVPEGQTCDQHPDRPAVARIQGETDSMGAELNDMCEECLAEYRRELKEGDHSGTCDWCKTHKPRLWNRRDDEEGMYGPVYQVCDDCGRRRDERLREEMARYEPMDDYDPRDDDEDICGKCYDSGEITDYEDRWRGYCTCSHGLRLKGEAEARYRAKSAGGAA